jgi:hypothetical protein
MERLHTSKRYNFSALSACLQTFNPFTTMERDGIWYAGVCRAAFFQRIWRTVDLKQLPLGFLVTSDGLAWYCTLPDQSPQRPGFFSRELVLREVRPLQRHFKRLLQVEGTIANLICGHYLHFGRYEEGESTTQFWERHHRLTIPDANGLLRVPYHFVAEIALTAARLPCSEAGFERAFSRLARIRGDRRRSIQDGLAEALLIIKLHGIPNVPQSSDLLDRVRVGPAAEEVSDSADGEPRDGLPPRHTEDRRAPASQPEPRAARCGEHSLELRIGAQCPAFARPR